MNGAPQNQGHRAQLRATPKLLAPSCTPCCSVHAPCSMASFHARGYVRGQGWGVLLTLTMRIEDSAGAGE